MVRLLLILLPVFAFGQQINAYKQVKNLPFVDIRTYNWFRTNGTGASGDLSSSGAGKTVTLAPCPQGLGGGNVGHAVRIDSGVGSAETVTITGGTCTSGAVSGTLIFTSANTHTGSWVVRSASGGIQEAFNLFKYVSASCGATTIYGTVYLGYELYFQGSGDCTELKPATSSLVMFTNADQNPSENGDNTHKWQMSGLTFSGRDFATNTVRAIQVINTHLGGFYQDAVAFAFTDLTFHNIKLAYYMDRVMSVQVKNTRATDNTTSWFGSTQGLSESRSYSITVDGYFHNPADRPEPRIGDLLSTTDALITFEFALSSRIRNFVTQSAFRAVGVRFKGLCEDVSLENSTIVAAYSGVELVDVSGSGPNWVKIVDSHIDNLEYAAVDVNATANYLMIANNQISNNGGEDTAEAIRISGNAAGVLIQNNVFQTFGSGSGSTSTRVVRLSAGANTQISGNLFVNNTPNARNIRIEGTAIRYIITNNMFWTGGGPATDPIDDAILDRWRLISGNRFNENDTDMGEIVNVTNYANRKNIIREIGDIDGTAGQNIDDHHTSGNNIDFDTRVAFSGGTGSSGNGLMTVEALRLVLSNFLNFVGVTFTNLSASANDLTICTDCAVTSGADNTCAGSGTGALAVRLNGVWRCFDAQN